MWCHGFSLLKEKAFLLYFFTRKSQFLSPFNKLIFLVFKSNFFCGMPVVS